MCGLIAVLTLAGPLGKSIWLADVVNLFRPYVAAAAGISALVCLLSRRRLFVALSLLLLALNLALLLLPTLRGERLPTAPPGGPRLKAITFNCRGDNPHVGAIVAWLREAKPDLVVLEEVSGALHGKLSSLRDILPYTSSDLQSLSYETEILSRIPMSAAQAYQPAGDSKTIVHALIALRGRPLHIYGLHPNTLQTAKEWRERNTALELSAEWIAQTRGISPALALGDWNTPPWSPYFATFLQLTGMRAADPLTWPPMTRVLAAPFGVRLGSSIDHIAATSGFRVQRCETGPQLDSDHAPQICWLRAPP